MVNNMSSFLQRWSSFDPKKWSSPNPEQIRTSEPKCTNLKEIVLPLILPQETERTSFIKEAKNEYKTEVANEIYLRVDDKVIAKYPHLNNLPKSSFEVHYNGALRSTNHEEIFDRLSRMMACDEILTNREKVVGVLKHLYTHLPPSCEPAILCYIATSAQSFALDTEFYLEVLSKVKTLDPALFYKLKAHNEWTKSNDPMMLRYYEMACRQEENGEAIYCLAIAYLFNKNWGQYEQWLKKLLEYSSFREWALKHLLIFYKDRNNHTAIEEILFSGFHLKGELNLSTSLLLADLHIQFFIRKKQYKDAWDSVLFYNELHKDNPLYFARRAQILMRMQVPGTSIEDICWLIEQTVKSSKLIQLPAYLIYELTIVKIEFALFIKRVDAAKKINGYGGHCGLYLEKSNLPEIIDVSPSEPETFLAPYEKEYPSFQLPESFYFFLKALYNSKNPNFKKIKQIAESLLNLPDPGEYRIAALFFKYVAVHEIYKRIDPTLLESLLLEFPKNSNPNLALIPYTEYCINKKREDLVGGMDLKTYEIWLKNFHKLPFVFTDFAKHAIRWKAQTKAIDILRSMEEKYGCIDLWHALAMLYYDMKDNQSRTYLKKCVNYNYACDVLGRAMHFKKNFAQACIAFEKNFLMIWNKANPKAYFSDELLDDYTKESVSLYIDSLMKVYQDDKTLVITHIQKFLDSIPVETRWKKSFAEYIHNFMFNSLTIQIPNNVTVHVTVTNPSPPINVSKESKPKRMGLSEEIVDWFQKSSKEIFDRHVDSFYKKHENRQDFQLKFNDHYKKAKQSKDSVEIAMHLIRMIKIQSTAAQGANISEIRQYLFAICDIRPNMEVLFILCVLSMNSSENPTYCAKLSEHYVHFVSLIKAIQCFDANKYDQTIVHLRESLKIDPTQSIVLLGLAVSHFSKQEFSLAAGYFIKLAKIDKNLANQAVLYALTCYKDTFDFDGIKKFLFETRDLDFEPNRDVQILSRQLFIDLLLVEGRRKEAIEWVQIFASYEPNDPFLMILQAKLVFNRLSGGENIVQELALMKRALASFNPDEFSTPLKFEFAQLHAGCLFGLGNYKESYAIGVEADKFAVSSERSTTYQLLYLLMNLKNTNGVAKARKEAKKLLEGCNKNSLNPAYLHVMASVLSLLPGSDFSEVAALAKRAIERDKTKYHHASCIGMVLLSCLKRKEPHQEFLQPFFSAILESIHGDSVFYYLFNEYLFQAPSAIDVIRQWLKRYSTVEQAFTDVAFLGLERNYRVEFLRMLKQLEQEIPQNPNLLHAIAILESTKYEQMIYITKCLENFPTYEHIHDLLAAMLFAKGDYEKAIASYEVFFKWAYRKTQPEYYFIDRKISKGILEAASFYVKALARKFSKGECLNHILELLAHFKDKNEWFTTFKKTLEKSLEEAFLNQPKPQKLPRVREISHFEEKKTQEEDEKEELPVTPSETSTSAGPVTSVEAGQPTVVVTIEQPQRIHQSFLEPDEEELALKRRLDSARSADKERLRTLLTNPMNIPQRPMRLRQEDVINNVARWAQNSCELNEMDYPKKARERFVDTNTEIDAPSPVIWERPKPAAAATTWVFPLLPPGEVKRLKQGAEILLTLEDFLNVRLHKDYNLDNPKDQFIVKRLLMYKLLRLGECLFTTSPSVKAKLNPVYTFTMDQKIISSEMIMNIRRQIRKEYKFVTLDKILRTCRYIRNSNLPKNLERWYRFNEFSNSEPALLRTVLPPSCEVVQSNDVILLVFLKNELGNLASLIDKVNENVFTLNPDVFEAAKMSVCILGELSHQFPKIKDLEYYQRFARKIAHVFGEDYDGEMYDEVSAFSVKHWVHHAQGILNDFFGIKEFKPVAEPRLIKLP